MVRQHIFCLVLVLCITKAISGDDDEGSEDGVLTKDDTFIGSDLEIQTQGFLS